MCPDCGNMLRHEGGCTVCPVCGLSSCDLQPAVKEEGR